MRKTKKRRIKRRVTRRRRIVGGETDKRTISVRIQTKRSLNENEIIEIVDGNVFYNNLKIGQANPIKLDSIPNGMYRIVEIMPGKIYEVEPL
jgi:hypothetical protein